MNIITSSLIAVVAWLLMIGHARYGQLSTFKRWALVIGVGSVAAKGITRLVMIATSNTLHPPEWDLVFFWINGVLGSRGLNFYDPVLSTQVAAPFHPSAGFVNVALPTPFLYPPPSIIWFVPLGWFDIHTSAAAWYAIQLVCLIASVIVLSLTFFETLSAIDVGFVAALLLMVHATYWNVANAQTVFLLLLFISLTFRCRNKPWGGVWLALAILVKPFAVVVMFLVVLQRKWRLVAETLITLLVATFVTFLIYGPAVFSSYFAIRFQKLPMSMYTELENQSLLAWFLRVTHSSARFPFTYLILVALSGGILLWRLRSRQECHEPTCFTLALIFGLLVYPASLRSYTVVLILPILVLYAARLWIPVAVAYGLMFVGQGDYVILATLAIGIALTVWLPKLQSNAAGISSPSCTRSPAT